MLVVSAVTMTTLAVACTSSGDREQGSATTKPSDDETTVPTTPPTDATTDRTTGPGPGLGAEIPVDPDVLIGELDNGLRYYVRENQAPGGRAALRLVVDAGSALEDDDQSGGAHFLEHMLFNGTELFPGNELISVLELFGAEFGPDVNAYTTVDETVYELTIPTDDDEIVDTALDVLLEWAANATIDEDDVNDERGVVLEEWRLSEQSADGRIYQQYRELLLAGTAYADSDPIGSEASIEALDADALRRFYEDWYRPDLMTIVAVGDFDVDDMEERIRDRFSDLPPAADEARERPVIPWEIDSGLVPEVVVYVDADVPSGLAEVLYPTLVDTTATAEAWRSGVAASLGWDMIATRLADDATRGDSPFLGASYTYDPIGRPVAMEGIYLDANPGDVSASVEAVLAELERVRRFGFSNDELERAVEARRAQAEQYYEGRDTTQDDEYADTYVFHALEGGPLPSAETELELETDALDALEAEDSQDALVALLDATTPHVFVVGPAADADALPSADDIVSIAAAVSASDDLEPRDAEAAALESLIEAPEPIAEIDASAILELGARQLDFANGVRVLLAETTIAEGGVAFQAQRPGGQSLVADDVFAESMVVAELVGSSGLGDVDRVALDRFLSDRVASVGPYLDETSEGFSGSSSTDDLEILFQLVHLFMTEPRIDDAAVATYLGRVRPVAADPTLQPELALISELLDARFGGDPRYRIYPSVAELDALDLDAALDVFRDRFGDASGFTFVFAGDFDPDDVEELSRRYLGTLPGSGRDVAARDRRPDPPQGVVSRTVRSGEGDQATLAALWSAFGDLSPRERLHMQVLQSIVNVRLRDHLREALSATYSPYTEITWDDDLQPVTESYFEVSGDPERIDEIARELQADLAELRAEGPEPEQLAAAVEGLSREIELVSNEWYIEQLLFYDAHPDEQPSDLDLRSRCLDEVTADDIADLARRLFPVFQYVEVRQVPAG